AEAVGQDLEDALAVHQAVLADAGAEDLEDQVLLLEPDVVLDALLLGDVVQAMEVHGLQVFDVELAALDLLVLGVGLGVKAGNLIAPATATLRSAAVSAARVASIATAIVAVVAALAFATVAAPIVPVAAP